MESWKPHPKGWGGCHLLYLFTFSIFGFLHFTLLFEILVIYKMDNFASEFLNQLNLFKLNRNFFALLGAKSQHLYIVTYYSKPSITNHYQ